MTPLELRQMSTKELKKIEKRLFDLRKTRSISFNKDKLLKGKFSKSISKKIKGKTKSEIIRNISTMSTWAVRPTSTARGYKKMFKYKREMIEKSLSTKKVKFKFKNWDEFDKFGKFMEDMEERLGSRWKYESMSAVKLFKEARRLNLDLSILKRNYEYWMDEQHFKKLSEAKKEDFKNLRHSTSNYIKKLNLETIKKWEESNDN